MPSNWCFAWALLDLLCRGQDSKTTHHPFTSPIHLHISLPALLPTVLATLRHQMHPILAMLVLPLPTAAAPGPQHCLPDCGELPRPWSLCSPLQAPTHPLILLRNIGTHPSGTPCQLGATLLQDTAALHHTPAVCCNFNVLPAVSCRCCCCAT